MKKTLIAIALSFFAGTALAADVKGEFNNDCAYGMSMGKKVQTDCSVREEIGGKTYCFSSEEAKSKFMSDAEANLEKAQEQFGRM